jgi:mRNA interferase RelE/StbE
MASGQQKFDLVIARSFIKDLKNIDKQDQIRIRQSLIEIQGDPFKGRKVISAEVGQYRWRVGKYRIRYDIHGKEIQILRVIKREDIYRRF